MKHLGNDQLNHDGYEMVVIALRFFSASIIKNKKKCQEGPLLEAHNVLFQFKVENKNILRQKFEKAFINISLSRF